MLAELASVWLRDAGVPGHVADTMGPWATPPGVQPGDPEGTQDTTDASPDPRRGGGGML